MRKTRSLFLVVGLIVGLGYLNAQTANGIQKSKPVKKASRVITNDDIPPHESDQTVSEASVPTSLSGKSSTPQASRSQKKDKPHLSEIGDDPGAINSRLKELDSDEANLAKGIQDLESLVEKEQDPSRREVLEHMIKSRQKSLARAKSERIELKATLAEQKKQ